MKVLLLASVCAMALALRQIVEVDIVHTSGRQIPYSRREGERSR
jgi:hypothetical protein